MSRHNDDQSGPEAGSDKSADRLNQISSHLFTPVSKDKPSTKPRAAPLPADHSDVLSQIDEIRTIARTPDVHSRGYIRQKHAGKLWVRERIEKLLDANSFGEIGSVAGTATWKATAHTQEKLESFVPSNNIQGGGLINGRKVLLTADDFTIRSGHADGATTGKTDYLEKLALTLRIPVIKLVDGSSGGGSVTSIRKDGWSYIPRISFYKYVAQQLDLGIPNLGAVLGPAIGLGAARVVSCHFSVMAADVGSLFNAGPSVVERATFEEDLTPQELGGPSIHCTNGTIDNVAANEEECFQQIQTVLSYLPNSGLEAPPVIPCIDSEGREDLALRSVIPRRQARMYNARTIIVSVLDRDSWFEIGGLWGRTVIGGLGRLGGRPIGVISLNPEVNGGALDAAASQKLIRLLKLCDVMNLPVLQFIDVPGYAIGTIAERAATMRWGVELAKTYYSTTIPIFNVITRRVYGVAGAIMIDSRDPAMQVAWPSGQWGSLPLAGGIEVAHRHELREAEKVGKMEERYKELEEEYVRLMSPIRTANAFGIEEIIDPKDTRKVCCSWASHVYDVLMKERLANRACGKIHPSFS